MSSTDTDELKREIETLGIFYEKTGMTPMQARVFALLLLIDPPHMDFFSIQDFLGASKSSISNAINRLIDTNRIDYLTLSGDRKRYFKVNPATWLEQMKVELDSVAPIVKTIDHIIQFRREMDTTAFNQELRRVRAFFAFMADEFPKMMKKWERIDSEVTKEEPLSAKM